MNRGMDDVLHIAIGSRVSPRPVSVEGTNAYRVGVGKVCDGRVYGVGEGGRGVVG